MGGTNIVPHPPFLFSTDWHTTNTHWRQSLGVKHLRTTLLLSTPDLTTRTVSIYRPDLHCQLVPLQSVLCVPLLSWPNGPGWTLRILMSPTIYQIPFQMVRHNPPFQRALGSPVHRVLRLVSPTSAPREEYPSPASPYVLCDLSTFYRVPSPTPLFPVSQAQTSLFHVNPPFHQAPTRPPPVQPTTFANAWNFLDQVKQQFEDNPWVYEEFLQIMKDFKLQT